MPHMYDSPSETSSRTSFLQEKRRKEHNDADVVVVGAGIAGCAIAVALGRQGRSVILLERSLKTPDRIVGELLQPGGVQALEKLGLRDCLEDIDAIEVHGYEVIYHAEPVNIAYPKNETTGTRPQGRSFHHGRFVSRLRDAAIACPNVTVVESTATALIKTDYTGEILGVEAKTAGKKACYFGQLTFITDGYASNLRSIHTKEKPIVRSKFFGLELTDCVLPKPYHGHVLLGNFSPVLLYQIGERETRILVDIQEGCPTAAPAVGGVKNHMLNVVLPILPTSVQPSFIAAINSGQTIRSMPNSWLPPKMNEVPGVVVLGDAMNMRHPLTGGGMTVAFNDVVLMSELLSPENVPSLGDSKKVLEQLKKFHWKRKDVTAVINILAQALYSLFAANGKFHSKTI